MMMPSLPIDQQLEQLNSSTQPFALYYFNQHNSLTPVLLLLTDLERQLYLKSLSMFNRNLKPSPNNHIACALNYAAGYKMEKRLVNLVADQQSLGWMGWFKQATKASSKEFKTWIKERIGATSDWPDFWLTKPSPAISYEHYAKQVSLIKDYIACGDTYQVNFTFPLVGSWHGNELSFFAALFNNQPVGYAALIRHQRGLIVSLSPELFFSKQGSQLITRPMKGTARRSQDRSVDKKIGQRLQRSKKNKAENLMIVDLLRNDLGRLCQIGSIKTKNLFNIEKYKTVYQMTSTIEGNLKPNTSWSALFKALFPCGSVTGAPKVRTMEIINSIEPEDRHLYTGACGYIEPNGDGQFNVPIRTIEINYLDRQLRCGIGSGIVIDSKAQSEWQESHDKSRFLNNLSKDYQLIETLKWSVRSGFYLLRQHIKRMGASATFFNIPFNHVVIEQALNKALSQVRHSMDYRVRIQLFVNGSCKIEMRPLQINEKLFKPIVQLAQHHVHSSNIFLYHKTTNRKLYNDYFKRAQKNKIMDYLFVNEQDHITEGSISNIFIVKNKRWFTPPSKDGLLPGIMRDQVIKQQQVQEKSLTIKDLRRADQLFITNSVKGLLEVKLSA